MAVFFDFVWCYDMHLGSGEDPGLKIATEEALSG
jgi:hypothetical protein